MAALKKKQKQTASSYTMYLGDHVFLVVSLDADHVISEITRIFVAERHNAI